MNSKGKPECHFSSWEERETAEVLPGEDSGVLKLLYSMTVGDIENLRAGFLVLLSLCNVCVRACVLLCVVCGCMCVWCDMFCASVC